MPSLIPVAILYAALTGRTSECLKAPAGRTSKVAHHLSRDNHHDAPHSRAHEILEIAEAIVLAVVAALPLPGAVIRPRSGPGISPNFYAASDTLRIQAASATDAANEGRMYNALTVAEWLKAEAHGER